MKQSYLLIISIFFFQFSYEQIKGYAENGDKIILYTNGTWKYADSVKSQETINDSSLKNDTIAINIKEFKKRIEPNNFVKSKKVDLGVHIDNSEWGVRKGSKNDNYEYRFLDKSIDCFAVLISESTNDIPLQNIPELILENIYSISTDAVLVNQEYRMVNGLKILCLQINGSKKRLKYSMLSYIYEDQTGIIQLDAYTTQKWFKKRYNDLEEFLNGLDLIK
jgi:hypothetical protein